MNFSRLCRSCMNDADDYENNFDSKIVEMFTFCTNITVSESEDQLPRQFCGQCASSIQSCFTFITTARDVNQRLTSMINCVTIKIEVVPEIDLDHEFQESDSCDQECLQTEEESQHAKYDSEYAFKDPLYHNQELPLKVQSKKKTKNFKLNTNHETQGECTTNINDVSKKKHTRIISKTKKSEIQDALLDCPLCDRKFKEQGHRKLHLRWHKETNVNDDSKNKFIISETKQPENQDALLDCPLCERKFKEQRHRKLHLRWHEETEQLMANKVYICDHCSRVFKKKHGLRLHMHTHDKSLKDWACDVCGSKFSYRQALLYHQRVHTGEKPYKCKTCDYSTAYRGNIRAHERAHKGERKHACPECGKAFNEKGALKRHMLGHNGERLYRCPYCGNMYRSSGNRRRHMIQGHKMDANLIPRLAKDGGPARRYVTEDVIHRGPHSLLVDRAKPDESIKIETTAAPEVMPDN